jgi:hypothetical protein
MVRRTVRLEALEKFPSFPGDTARLPPHNFLVYHRVNRLVKYFCDEL